MSNFPPPTYQPPRDLPSSQPVRKAPVGRRVKPARGAKVASLALSAVSTLGLAALFANQDDAPSTLVATPSPGATGSTTGATVPFQTESADSSTGDTTGADTRSADPTSADPTSADAGVADGVFVGVPDTNRWGTVQVQIVVSGGVLTDVQVLSSPDSDRKSVRINERALPTLTAEALAAQAANIDSVSGATYTWRSYTISLQSALDAATFTV